MYAGQRKRVPGDTHPDGAFAPVLLMPESTP